MWIAPNMITTIGGMHCLFVYLILWKVSPNMDENVSVPDGLLVLSAYCTFVYYTLDCMDGKQARRTNTSSPLGQLFDHGMDCFCNIFHPATVASYTMIGGTYSYFKIMSSLQFAFFTAQWEEYYTHVLPHGCGKLFGVTEVNYGVALLSLVNAFINREVFWLQSLRYSLPGGAVSILQMLPYQSQVQAVLDLQTNEFGANAWFLLLSSQCFLSFFRTLPHCPTLAEKLSAMSKLFSPLALACLPFLVPFHLVQNNTRLISIAMGLMFDLITKKMIVFSMAKMSFAMLQFDIVPFLFLTVCMRNNYFCDSSFVSNHPVSSFLCDADQSQSEEWNVRIMIGLCLWHLYRLSLWCRLAILQITKRLDIYCFTIKPRTKKE